MKPPVERRPKVIDLFAGVGGLSLGAARAGFDVVLAVERDARISAGHQLNFPSTEHSCVDVGRLSAHELLRLSGLAAGELDGIIGGPPCQGFSSIGHKNAADHRNRLFVRFFQLIRDVRPPFFLAENVPGILGDAYSALRKEALALVSEYNVVGPLTVRAADYGAPTSRTRVIYFGYLPGVLPEFTDADFAAPADGPRITVREALRGLPTKIKPSWLTHELGWRKVRVIRKGEFWERVFERVPPGVGDAAAIQRLLSERRVSGLIATAHSAALSRRYGALSPGERDPATRSVRLIRNGFCPTLRAGTAPDHGSFQAVRPIHPTEPRVITPREAARLQGFPDWFQFDQTKWHAFRQIGNSVSPIVAEHLLTRVREKVVAARYNTFAA